MHLVLVRPGVRLYRTEYEVIKRCLDVTACVILFPFLLPVLVGCAVLTWLDDPGPVFFRQRRTGKGGRRFVMYKFRTMRVSSSSDMRT